MPKVLLITPNLNIPGGVCEFNKMLMSYSNAKITPFVLSGTSKNQNQIIKYLLSTFDFLRFLYVLCFSSIQIVHLGPSLIDNAIKRDGVYCWLAKLFNKNVYVHWHGWNPSNEYLLEPPHLNFLKKTLFLADHIRFLSTTFQSKFCDKNFKHNTSIGNTFIDDKLLVNFVLEPKLNSKLNILFLSTISKNKGIHLAIEAFKKIVLKYDITLTIAGVGPELEKIKKDLQVSLLDKIVFKGYVTGFDKIEVYKKADIYIFPSYYEGMPTSVIEAMGFGLPIICSSVGALPDFFIHEKMGLMIDKQKSILYANALERLIKDPLMRSNMNRFNHTYVKNNFLASSTINKIDEEYQSLLIKKFSSSSQNV